MLRLSNISKTYDHAPLLRDISLTIEANEIICLLGTSGSGKTTLLRVIAGLEQPESGEILFEGQDLRDVPVHQRGLGLMFQDLALFPHKNVFDNVAFGLQMQNLTRREIRTRVHDTLELVGLAGFAGRDVNNLSGGEQQRVALARSLAPRPKLLMLDEPLGALDRILREQLVTDLRTILKKIGMTALYVTHDQDEASAIADRIAIIHDGHIVQIGAPEEIYRAPANAFVARFLGLTNLFPAHLHADGRAETELGTWVIASDPSTPRRASVKESPSDWKIDPAQAPHITMTVALIRPERVRVNGTGQGIPARVEECTFRAGKHRVRVVTETGVQLILESERAWNVGTRVGLDVDTVEVIPA